MESKVSYILVGVFVLLLAAALIAGVLWFGAGGPHAPTQLYVTYLTESASGLNKDSMVRYRGVEVGRVRSIGLDPKNPQRVRLLLEINRGTPVSVDTVATLETRGLTGIANVNLTGGSAESPPLRAEPGEKYPVIQSRPSLFGQLDKEITVVLHNLNEATTRLNELLSDANQRAMGETLANLESISGTLAGQSRELRSSIDDFAGLMHNARVASASLPGAVQRIESSAVALEKMANSLAQAAGTLQHTVQGNGQQIRRFTAQTLPEASAAIGDLRQAAGSLRRLSQSLENNPSILLYGPPPRAAGPGE